MRARSLLARGYAREIQAAYADAVRDIEAAITSARETGDRRMEMTGLIALGGDAPAALGRPVPEAIATLHRGLSLATALSDRVAEASLRARLAILAVSGLRFTEAVEQGRLGELEPLLRRRGDLRLLSWTQFESAFPAIAAGDWVAASARIEESLATGRRIGSMAHAAWHIATSGALARLQGHQAEALRRGRRAVAASGTEPHAWAIAIAAAELATTLLETGERDEAIALLERALTAGPQQDTEAPRQGPRRRDHPLLAPRLTHPGQGKVCRQGQMSRVV